MYKAKLWDEDKWDIHSKSYSSSKYGSIFAEDKKEEKKYHEQKYGSKDKGSSSDYVRKEDAKDDEDEKKPALFDELEEKKEQKIEDEDIPFRAAKQLFSEKRHEAKAEKRKDVNSIEEAIKKAVEEEKKLIIMDS